MAPLIQLSEITKSYERGGEVLPVLRGITLSIEARQMVALIGVSGSGKSTLMNILGCLDRPTSGKYQFDGIAVEQMSDDQLADLRSKAIGFVFQNFNLLSRTSVLENVLLPTMYASDPKEDSYYLERAHHVLERVGLADRLQHTPGELSGGQQQRVAIARALMNEPRLILADEPTGNLDTKRSEEILELFDELHTTESVTILLVTHEPSIADHCQRKIKIVDGVLAA